MEERLAKEVPYYGVHLPRPGSQYSRVAECCLQGTGLAVWMWTAKAGGSGMHRARAVHLSQIFPKPCLHVTGLPQPLQPSVGGNGWGQCC